MNDGIISVENLEHRFGDFTAVDNISFSVQAGEIFSFLGPNGAGKSTTINVLTTLLPLQRGTVRVAGHDVARNPVAVRSSISIVFQNVVLDRDLTARETLEFHGRLYEIPKNERRSLIDDLLCLMDLEAKADARTKYLSGGMKRRLEMARGLMSRPRVLFLDEPTVGLDPQTRMKIWDYIRRINEEGTTIFLTTHYMDEADHLSDRINIIDHGAIIAGGSPAELKSALGQDMIYLETDDNARALAVLGDHDVVVDGSVSARGLAVSLREDGAHCLPTLLDLLRLQGVAVASVNLKKPTMDDVFIHHTGKELREEGASGIHPHMNRHRRRPH